MNILFFTKGDENVASSRQRVWVLAEKLKERCGYDYHVIHSAQYSFFSLSKGRLRVLWTICRALYAESYTFLFIHKSLFPWDVVFLILTAKFFLRKKLIYDFDDAEWVHSPAKTMLLTRCADAIFSGSHEILEWARRHNSRAIYVPTVVDSDLYASYRVFPAKKNIYTIGWVGSGARHFRDGVFAVIKPILTELYRRGVPFRFVVIGSEHHKPLKDFFHNVPFRTIFVDELRWQDPHAVARAIHEYAFDVGVMPQNDDVFNRAKCSFKAIEYMACGVPPVASRVGENTVLIKDGVNGFLASTTAEWIAAMEKLLRDEELRERIGEEAQRTVRERYSYNAILPTVISYLRTE